MKKQNLHIGTSGWSYSDWKGAFYPAGIKSTDWLSYYSGHFNAVEINSSFYHLPRKKTVINWIEKVPANFRFCPKMSRYLTHIKKLKDPEDSLEKFYEVFEPIKKHIGHILVQIPPSLKFDASIAAPFFEALKKYDDLDFAFEVRSDTWLQPAPIALLEKYKIPLVISQSGVGFPYTEQITSTDIYLRFHGPEKLYNSSYTPAMLEIYAGKIKKWLSEKHQVWVFFNNTAGEAGLKNATLLKTLVAAA
jgi:uncharacterized protein YecE (DUF72 family)